MKQTIKLFAVLAVLMFFLSSCEKKNMPENTSTTEMKNEMGQNVKAEAEAPILKFSSKDLNGKPVTDQIFNDYDVTLVNVWATWCPPCRAEMPDLEKVYKKYTNKNCNVVALTSDVYLDEADNIDIAKQIIKDSGVTFTTVQSIDAFNAIYAALPGLPTSFLVDKNGKILKGTFHTGRLDIAGFEKLFDAGLSAVNKDAKM